MSDFLITIHAIVVSDPDVAAVATGAWNPDGTPVMKKASRQIPPDAPLLVSMLQGGLDEAQELVAMEAARWPTPQEIETLGGGL